MKQVSGSIKILLLLSVFLLGAAFVWKGYTLHLQLAQAERTLMFLKSISSWQAELLQKDQLPESYIEFAPFNLYTTLFYHAQDTSVRQIVIPPNAYLVALAVPKKLDTVPYGLYVETPADKAYCLAHETSRAAKRFCSRLGAQTGQTVEIELQGYPEIAGYNAYALPRWKGIPQITDEPVDAWRYLKEEK